MFSSHWPPCFTLAIKALALAAGVLAAGIGWHAARLWRDASQIEMPEYDPPLASIGDAPELHTLSSVVQLNSTVTALKASGALNARAARWTAFAAVLTGAAAILGAL